MGQSIVSSVRALQKNMDKMMTYMQQILRDTANAKIFETRNTSQYQVNPQNVNKRGTVYQGQINEDVRYIVPPPIAPEMRSHQIDVRQQISRGLFPDLSFGDSLSQVSVYAMSQATATAQQVLEPYQEGIKQAIGHVLTNFARMSDKLDFTEFLSFNYTIQIPGDFTNRANTARMLNPNYVMSANTINRELFPAEITSPLEESGKVITEQAMMTPEARAVLYIREFRRAAADANLLNDSEFADLLTKASNILEQNIFGDTQSTSATSAQALSQAINQAERQ